MSQTNLDPQESIVTPQDIAGMDVCEECGAFARQHNSPRGDCAACGEPLF